MSEHTPEDWRVEFDELGGFECLSSAYIIQSASGERIAVVDVDDYVVATGDSDERWEMRHGKHERAEANANLFAGAADLLKACKELLSHLPNDLRLAREDVVSGTASDYQRTVIAVHAAIARAEGRDA